MPKVPKGVASAAVQAETCDDCGHYLKILHTDRDPHGRGRGRRPGHAHAGPAGVRGRPAAPRREPDAALRRPRARSPTCGRRSARTAEQS
jgi:hypothetical protein